MKEKLLLLPLPNTSFSKGERATDYCSDTVVVPGVDIDFSQNIRYHLDLTETIIDYQNGLYGDFDEKGVPYSFFNGQMVYNPVTILQFGLICIDLYIGYDRSEYLDRAINVLDRLEIERIEYLSLPNWAYNSYNEKYSIEAPYYSGMAVGEAISFYSRMSKILGNESLMNVASGCFDFLKIPFEKGGVARIKGKNFYWIEEYPTNEPSFVLNGFVYSIFGIYDYWKFSSSEEAKSMFELTVNTLLNSLGEYDIGYWSVYDVLKRELVKKYYQKNVHVPQMMALYNLTGEQSFLDYGLKWKRQISTLNLIRVELMYRIKPRIDQRSLFLR
ncbi:D-glucuronyl C5-epimerase family protein [Cryomorphaceae bacterium 1068]|nr:D-glucuronyl C5-epimerase family protein [Cryomorphaceae bacterium 1068]